MNTSVKKKGIGYEVVMGVNWTLFGNLEQGLAPIVPIVPTGVVICYHVLIATWLV